MQEARLSFPDAIESFKPPKAAHIFEGLSPPASRRESDEFNGRPLDASKTVDDAKSTATSSTSDKGKTSYAGDYTSGVCLAMHHLPVPLCASCPPSPRMILSLLPLPSNGVCLLVWWLSLVTSQQQSALCQVCPFMPVGRQGCMCAHFCQ